MAVHRNSANNPGGGGGVLRAGAQATSGRGSLRDGYGAPAVGPGAAAARGRVGSGAGEVRRIERDLWALTPHLYAVSAKSDLVANLCRIVAEGLLALGPG